MTTLGKIFGIFGKGRGECYEVRRLSSRYLANDLDQPLLQRVQAHLSACGPCRAFVNGVANTVGLLGKLPKGQAPTSLKQSIIDHVRSNGKG